MEIRVGDLVEVTKQYDTILPGSRGIVRKELGDGNSWEVEITYNKDGGADLHRCGNLFSSNIGYFIGNDYLKVIDAEGNRGKFKVGDMVRVVKASPSTHNGEIGKIERITSGIDPIVVRLSNGFEWYCQEVERIEDTSQTGTKTELEENKMKPAETKLEKAALEQAKKEQVEAEIKRKAEDYKINIQNWMSYERNARSNRKTADELAATLKLSKEDKDNLL